MIKLLFNAFFSVIKSIVAIFMTPINLLVVGLFPNLATIITNFNNGVNTYIGRPIAYFSSMLPPITRSVILIWFGVLIAYYGVSFSVHVILKIIEIVKKVKIW